MSRIHRQTRPRVVSLEVARNLQAEAHRFERTAHALQRDNEALRRENRDLRLALDAIPEPQPQPEPEPAQQPEPDERLHRLAADLQNVRRHRDEQIAQAGKTERIAGLRRLAEVRDTLALGLQSLPEQEGPWFEGQRAILQQVTGILASGGAEPFAAVGDAFDPTMHEAVGTAAGEPDTLIAVQQDGFRLDDGTLIRPARVVVGVS